MLNPAFQGLIAVMYLSWLYLFLLVF